MQPDSEETGRPGRILVIDHDPHILSQVRRILERNRYEVFTAASGQAGLKIFQDELPDLVLLDLNLPDIGGLDVLAEIKAKRSFAPVMVIAAASEMSAIASLRHGADDYISKPISPEELLDRVGHNLEKGRQSRARAELTEQLQRQLAVMVSMRDVAREASSAADLYYLLQRVLDQTMRTMGYDAGIILVSEGRELVPLVHRGLPQAISSALTRRRLTWDDPALRPLLSARQAVRTHSGQQQGGPLSQAVGYRFTAAVPLWAQGQHWGLLEVAGRGEDLAEGQALEMLTAIGQQLAIALANARLKEAAAMRVRELALLNEACLALTSDLDLEQILTTIMLRTNDVIGVEAGSLLLVDESTGELVFRISLGGNAGQILSQRVPPGKGIAGWVFQQNRPLLVPDVHQDARYYPEIDHYTGFQTRSILCVPLQVRGEPLGVIELVNKISGEFREEDLRLLESIAALTATAIEQSRLLEWTTSFILIDPLTRLPNERFLREAMERESARCRRYRRTCSLLLLGVDRRLSLPDARWRELATVIKKALRQSDLLCRDREGHFVAILPETGAEGARSLVNRLCGEIARSGLQEPAGINLVDHIRWGVASYPEAAGDPKELLERARSELIQAWQKA